MVGVSTYFPQIALTLSYPFFGNFVFLCFVIRRCVYERISQVKSRPYTCCTSFDRGGCCHTLIRHSYSFACCDVTANLSRAPYRSGTAYLTQHVRSICTKPSSKYEDGTSGR